VKCVSEGLDFVSGVGVTRRNATENAPPKNAATARRRRPFLVNMPLAKKLRTQSRYKLEEAILIRRMALALSPSIHREAMLAWAARLQAEAEALETEAAEVSRTTP
jgi:hypothetical protein